MTQFPVTLFSIILFCLILLATFFSCAETALMAMNRYRLRHKARMRKRSAIYLLQLLKRPDRLLGAILIGSTFANILASSLATLIAFHFWGDKGAFIAAIVLTIVILIFAEITPKTLAAIYPDQVARWIVYPIRYFLKIMYPIVWLANAITNGLLRLLRIRVTTHTIEPLSREELRSVVYDTTGKISRKYQNMLLSILDLSKLTVDDVMIPRNEIIGIDIELPWGNIVQQVKHLHQEWMPVYRNDINQIIGVLHIGDVLLQFLTQQSVDKKALEQILKDPYFVPEGTPLNVQLGHFQQSQNKIAFVVDEYGDVQGMLTLNDILEEIVGDFTNISAKRMQEETDGSFLVDGAITVREFNRASNWELPLGGPRTISGLIIEYLEALPHPGTAVLIADYPIEIVLVKANRVKLARIFPRLREEKSFT